MITVLAVMNRSRWLCRMRAVDGFAGVCCWRACSLEVTGMRGGVEGGTDKDGLPSAFHPLLSLAGWAGLGWAVDYSAVMGH